MAKPQQYCIFCGDPGLSKEHIMPDWLRVQMPEAKRQGANFVLRSLGETLAPGRSQQAEYRKTRQGGFLTRKARVVCRTCNNGWMSVLEERVKPTLLALIFQKLHFISVEDQRALSAWIAIKAAINERFQLVDGFGYDEFVSIPESECRYLMENLEPTNKWRIIIYNYAGGEWSYRHLHYCLTVSQKAVNRDGVAVDVSSPPAVKPDTQTTTFGIGHFVFHAFSSFGAITTNAVNPARNLGNIWPPRNVPITWPHGRPITDREVDELALSFYRKLKKAGVDLPPLGDPFREAS